MPVLNIKLELDADNFKVNSSQVEGITGKLDASFASATAKAASFAFAFNNIFEIAGRLTSALAAPVQKLVEVDEVTRAAAEAFQTKLDGAIINIAKDLRPLILGTIDFASALLDVNWTPFVVGAGAAGTALIAMNLSGIVTGLGALVPALSTATTAIVTFGGTVSVATGGITLLVGALAGLATWIITSIDNEDDLAKKRKESAEENIKLIRAERDRIQSLVDTNGATQDSTDSLKAMNDELIRQQIIISDSNLTILKKELEDAKDAVNDLTQDAVVPGFWLGTLIKEETSAGNILRGLMEEHKNDVVAVHNAASKAFVDILSRSSQDRESLSEGEKKRLDDESKAYKEIITVISSAAKAQTNYNSELETRKRLLTELRFDRGQEVPIPDIVVNPGAAGASAARAAAAVQASIPAVRMDVAIAQNREALSLFVADSEKVFDDADELLRLRFENNLISEQEYFDERMNLLGEFHRAQVGMWGEESAQALAVNAERLEMERRYTQQKIALSAEGVAASLGHGARLANASQGVNETLFSVGRAFARAQALADTYAAANRALAAFPPPFSFIAAASTIAAGLLNVAKVDEVKFQRRATGGIIGDSGIAGDFGGGENRLLIANDGEFVVNAEQTRRNRALLELLNAGGFNAPRVQQSGAVSGGLNFDPAAMGKAIGENIRIELRTELDAIKFYRRTFPEYQRREAERTV